MKYPTKCAKRSVEIYDAVIDHLRLHGETAALDLALLCECNPETITHGIDRFNGRLREEGSPLRVRTSKGERGRLILKLTPRPVFQP